jgi:1,2-diacylglycerol 3-beta-galactosyltransferase
MTRRILVLTSDTGAGHRSVADALAAGAAEQPERQVELVPIDPFRPLPPSLRRIDGQTAADRTSPVDRVVRLYGPVIVHAPWLWGWAFYLTDNRLGLGAYLTVAGPGILRRITTAVEAIDAQAIVSVHPLVNHLMVRARARTRRPWMPLLTVLTDLLAVHRWWVASGVDHYVAGTETTAGKLHQLGVPPSKISVLGIPLRREFGTTALSAREMRTKLGLDPELSTVLLMGGGDGAGRLTHTARAIGDLVARGVPRFQLVVLTGRNRRARVDLEARHWPLPVEIRGLVNDIAGYMTAADIVVTKPGSLTVSETLAIGRPLLLGKPLPGQETENIRYVVEGGAGLAYTTPAEAADAVEYLLGDPATRWEMSQRAARLSRPRATERTLDLLQSLLLRAEVGRHTVG